jgi:Cu+-exporting ATPase
VFDKTGTLTVGKPLVVTTKLFNNMSVKDFYEFVVAAEVSLLNCVSCYSFFVTI